VTRQQINKKIEQHFSEQDRQQIIDLLMSLEHWPQLAGDHERLNRLQLAVLDLAQGNISRLIHYINCARQDDAAVVAQAKLDSGT
jgi:hypothetical protein